MIEVGSQSVQVYIFLFGDALLLFQFHHYKSIFAELIIFIFFSFGMLYLNINLSIFSRFYFKMYPNYPLDSVISAFQLWFNMRIVSFSFSFFAMACHSCLSFSKEPTLSFIESVKNFCLMKTHFYLSAFFVCAFEFFIRSNNIKYKYWRVYFYISFFWFKSLGLTFKF
jgi:hypothetical protein